jgi:cytochrome c553
VALASLSSPPKRHIKTMRGLMAAMVLLGVSTRPGSTASFEERIAVCLACHGEKGQPTGPAVPALGAQTEAYTLIQLYMFREKLRIVEIMNEAVTGLTDDDLRKFAGYISKLPAKLPVAGQVDAARMSRGRTLVERHHCDICHKQDLAGRENVPRIAGQREEFLVKALGEYRSNARPGYDASMADVVQPLSDGDILELAYYIARQP